MADEKPVFNYDILLDPKDLENARTLYEPIVFALDFKRLRDVFGPINENAGRFKKESQFWGLLAVAGVSASLLLAALTPLLPEDLHVAIAIIAALLGAAGTLIGFVGIRYEEPKRNWLYRRMHTERLRQLHFQILVRYAPLIVAAVKSPAKLKEFEDKREAALAKFEADYIKEPANWFTDTLADDELNACWRVDPAADALDPNAEGTAKLLEALTNLRIDHQIGYVKTKLNPEQSFAVSAERQTRRFAKISFAAACFLIGLDIVMLFFASGAPFWRLDAEQMSTIAVSLHVATVVFAILALTLRVLEEGFRSHSETERYRQYRSALLRVRRKFDAAGADAAAKLSVLEELEEVTYREMVDFLAANNEARFVM